jgi:hypothetical protein
LEVRLKRIIRGNKKRNYSSLDEFDGSLILADLEQLAHSLLVGLETNNLSDKVANELAVLIWLINQSKISR